MGLIKYQCEVPIAFLRWRKEEPLIRLDYPSQLLSEGVIFASRLGHQLLKISPCFRPLRNMLIFILSSFCVVISHYVFALRMGFLTGTYLPPPSRMLSATGFVPVRRRAPAHPRSSLFPCQPAFGWSGMLTIGSLSPFPTWSCCSS